MLTDERAVVQVRVRRQDAIEFGRLARAQGLGRVQAFDAFQQSLAAQHFVATGDAACEAVGHVEHRSIAVGDLRVQREPRGRDSRCLLPTP